MYVWLTENAAERDRTYGIFTSAEKGKEVCQKVAEQFFGKRTTRQLDWRGDGDQLSAYHEDPGGRYLFVITRYAVDERKEY